MKKGFTLVELMLVVIILGILVGLIVPRLVGRSEEARKAAARADMQGIATALDLYEMDVGKYPEALTELCTQPPDPIRQKRWKGPYLKKCSEEEGMILDPWGTEYQYAPDTQKGSYKLYSCGPDGTCNEGGGDDIVYGKKERGTEEF